MALKRATYARPLGQVLGPDEYEGMSVTAKLKARAQEKQMSMQILVVVVVASIQLRTLMTEKGKDSMWMALVHKLLIPKRRGEACPTVCSCARFEKESG